MPRCALLLSTLLTACAAFAPTPYAPAPEAGDYGYRSERLADGRWCISVHGNAATDAATLRSQWLLRAAEIALAAGANGFIVAGGGAGPRIEPAYLMPQFGAATGGFRPLVRYQGYAPGVVPSRQLIAKGVMAITDDHPAQGRNARRLCRTLAPRFAGSQCPPER